MGGDCSVRLLVVTQYFWPETFIIQHLVKTLVEQGHRVVVLTGKPNYPDGEIFAGYTEKGVQAETYSDCVEVHRVPLRPRGKGAFNLFRNYLSFVLSGLRFFPRMVSGQDFDAILVFAPSPITMAIPAIYLKWRRKWPLAVWIQDLWPESLSATGYIRNPWILRMVGWMVRWIYRCSDTLLIQSKAFYEPVAHYSDASKIVYYPNSIRSSQIDPQAADEVVLPETLSVLLESNFCVVFAGNLGKVQAVETLVDVASRLRDLPDCKIVLVGSGSMLDWVSEQKDRLGLSNLVLAGRFPMDMMGAIYNRAEALLVTLRDEDIFARTIPSKVQAYLASGKPILAAVKGEGARVVTEAGAGVAVPPEDGEALSEAIRTLYRMPELERAKMGASGRRYFEANFEMESQARRLVEILMERNEQGRRQV